MPNETPPPSRAKPKINRKLQLERAARARATITAFINGVPDAPYVTYGDLAGACADIKGADISNVVSRMVKNKLLTETKLTEPIGRFKVGYALPRPNPLGMEELPLPEVRAKRKYTTKSLGTAPSKPTVVVTDKDITVDYPHMRVIIQVVPT